MQNRYDFTNEELNFLQSLGGGVPKRNEKLYGFIPGNWLPNWVKQGYNQSIEGLAQQVVKGEPVFKIDSDYDPNMLADIGSTVVSFLTPTDFATMALGGGAGGLALRAATKQASKQMLKSGLKKELADSVTQNSSRLVFEQARERAVKGSAGLGFYSGLQSALGQQVTNEDIDFTRTLKDAAIGATLGGLSGGTGAVTKATALKRGFSARRATAIEKGSEAFLFGTAGPLIEGELPTVESYIHAAGVIGGLTLSRAAKDNIFKPKSKQVTGEKLQDIYRESAQARVDRMQAQGLAQEIWTNGKQNVNILTDWTKTQKTDTMLKVREVNKDGTPGKDLPPISKTEFFKSSKDGGFRLKTDSSGRDVDVSIRNKTFKLANDLKITDQEFKLAVDKAAGKEFDIKPSERRKGRQSTNYDKIKNDFEARAKLLKEFEKRQAVDKEIKEYQKLDIPIYESSGSSLFKKVLPGPVYDVLVGLKPLQSRVKDPRFKPIFNDVMKDYYTMDARQATLFQQLAYALNNATYITRDGKRIKGLKKIKSKELREQLGEDLQSPDVNAQVRVADFRKILNDSYQIAKQSGIDVAQFESNYFPRKIRRDLIKQLRDDIEKFTTFDSRSLSFELKQKKGFEENLKRALDTNVVSRETRRAIESIRDRMVRDMNRPVKLSEAFESLRNEVFSEIVITNKNLEIGRKKVSLPQEFFEKDAGLILTDYVAQLSKRVSFVETAGQKGHKVYDKIKSLRDLGGRNESELLYKAINTFTGTIEVDRKYNYSPRTKGILNDIVNFQVATKIGLGFATIPNLTQPFISSVLKSGYGPFFRGTYKLITDKNYRKAIVEYSGASSLELHQMLAGFNPSNVSFMGKVADKITFASGFQGVNKLNKFISAYTGYEAALKWQRIAKNSKIKARVEWAKSNLKNMGIDDINKKLTPKELSKAMYEFSRDTQLQRNVFREPAFFNDPRMQPFVLFKRFGYRQAEWVLSELKKEVVDNKNFAFVLRLGLAGMAGGAMVNVAKSMLSDGLAGRDIYSDNYNVLVDGKNFTMNDFLGNMAAVGGLGIVTDIINSESKWRAIEFAVKPAMIQDASKAYQALQRLQQDLDIFGPSWVTAQRSVRNVAPIFGSVGRRVLSRLETPGQRANYVKFRLGRTRAKILDFMIDENTLMAERTIREWNNSFPERPIRYEDIDINAINQRLMTKYKKQLNP